MKLNDSDIIMLRGENEKDYPDQNFSQFDERVVAVCQELLEARSLLHSIYRFARLSSYPINSGGLAKNIEEHVEKWDGGEK